jgi:hypothetical protein
METVISAPTITHFGRVQFHKAMYTKAKGSENWSVFPVKAFNLPPKTRPAVGQVRIEFESPITYPYTVLVTAERYPGTPLVSANYGDTDEFGFVVNLFETVADRTLQNASFSFAVIS